MEFYSYIYMYVNSKIKYSFIIIYFAETTFEGYLHLLSTVKTTKILQKTTLTVISKLLKMKKLKFFCYSPKKRTNLLPAFVKISQLKYEEWNACPRQAFHLMLTHTTKFQRMPKSHLQKQVSRLTKSSHLSCTKLGNVSA